MANSGSNSGSNNANSKYTSVAERLDILRKLENGMSVRDLAQKCGVSERSIRRHRQNASSTRQFAEDPRHLDRRRIRVPTYNLDKELYNWFVQRRFLGEHVTDNMLREQAKKLYEENGGPNSFAASRGWLWRFKKKYDIRLTSTQHMEEDDADNSMAEKFVEELARFLEENEITEDNLYNVDETNLFWRMLPNKISASAQNKVRVQCEEIKRDRVTVGLCANASGTHKLPLLFVNRYENPRALKHCKNNLPVTYKCQTNAWVDCAIFYSWYQNDFKRLVRQRHLEQNCSGKVVLLVDNFRGHKLADKEMDDGHFRLMFLPLNTSSMIQPIEQGVAATFKRSFRCKLLWRALRYEQGATEFYADYDVKDCIDLMHEAWTEITSDNISKSWNKILNRERLAALCWEEESTSCAESYPTLSVEEVREWMNDCEAAELIEEDDTEEEHCDSSPETSSPLEPEEIDRLFYYLNKIMIKYPHIMSNR